MPIFAESRNIGNIGLFFTAYAIAMIISRIFTGKIADRYGFYKAFLPSIIITFFMFIILAFAYSLPVVLLAAVFYGVGFGTLQPIMNAIVIKLSPPERRGAANATYYATMDISFGLGSLIWGAVSQYFGFTTVFLACATSVVISLIMYYLLLHPLVRNTF
jgi:MFS family permease